MNNPDLMYGVCALCGMLGGMLSGAMIVVKYIVRREKTKQKEPNDHIQIVFDGTTTTINGHVL